MYGDAGFMGSSRRRYRRPIKSSMRCLISRGSGRKNRICLMISSTSRWKKDTQGQQRHSSYGTAKKHGHRFRSNDVTACCSVVRAFIVRTMHASSDILRSSVIAASMRWFVSTSLGAGSVIC